MSKQQTIIGLEKPKLKRVHRAHVIDAGDDMSGNMICKFKCFKCGYVSDWIRVDTASEAKRGILCQNCNKVTTNDNA